MQQLSKDLRLLFWGEILLIIDFYVSSSSNGIGIKFDLFNDLIGAFIVLTGVVGISKFPISDSSFKKPIRVAIIASILQVIFAISEFVIYDFPLIIQIMIDLIGLFLFFGMIMLCKSMVILTREQQLSRSKEKWQLAGKLFLWFNLVPFTILKLINWINTFAIQANFDWQLESAISVLPMLLLTFLLILVPAIYYLFAIHNTRKELDYQE